MGRIIKGEIERHGVIWEYTIDLGEKGANGPDLICPDDDPELEIRDAEIVDGWEWTCTAGDEDTGRVKDPLLWADEPRNRENLADAIYDKEGV